jgi:hypothetical protein
MEKMKMNMLAAMVLTAAAVLAGCASGGGSKSEKGEYKPVLLEHKGSVLDKPVVPWLDAYLERSVPGVEAMSDYSGKYCIVADEMAEGDNLRVLQQLLTWVNNFNAQQQIGAQISTRVASSFKANENKIPDNEETRRKFSNAINTLVSATYSGARKEGDWWIKQRIQKNKQESEIRYSVYVLYSISKETLNEQIVSNVAKIKRENPGLDAAFDAITATILEKGMEWDMDQGQTTE